MKGTSAAGEEKERALGWAPGTVGWEGEVRENRPKQGWWARDTPGALHPPSGRRTQGWGSQTIALQRYSGRAQPGEREAGRKGRWKRE